MGSFTKKEQIIILIVVLIIIISIGFKFLVKDIFIKQEEQLGLVTQINPEINDIIDNKEIALEEVEDPLIMVHISGQVYTPGIIQLVRGDRVIDAVKLAGGLTKEADLDRINLAKKVEDEEKIYVPKIGEEVAEEITSEINLISSSQSNSQNNTDEVNINNCSLEELKGLPGIGDVIAGRIIDYRTSNPFRNIEELKNVSGIGDKKFEDIKNFVIVK